MYNIKSISLKEDMYLIFGMLMVGVVVYLLPLGRKGRKIQTDYWTTKKIKLDDYDEEEKNLDKLMR